MLVSLSSCRGAPGVSSWALILATAWPEQADRILVEADGSGGVFGSRYDVPLEPGASRLVSFARRGRFDDTLDLNQIARQLKRTDSGDHGLWVVPAPLSSHESLDAWRTMVVPTAEAMQRDDRLWLADCGRVWHGAPAEALLTVAPLNVVVSDGTMPSLLVLKSRVEAIPNRVAVLVVGSMKYSTDDLVQFTGADYVWNVPYIKRLDALAAEFSTSARARRSKIWRTALDIAHTLATDIARVDAPPPGAMPSDGPVPEAPPSSPNDLAQEVTPVVETAPQAAISQPPMVDQGSER